ncbi:DUF349 domain-containing protein [Neptunomonas sp.]|uniref:DUF349 domain-containing protein n=1 Tax=Neptunomonas sp. TaxID=1971898 RepID=UPI00356910DE
MLSKFFKPKWQHTSPTIRLNAVKNLRDDCDDQYRILSTLAIHDPDTHVRHAAIERINSINNLIRLLQSSASLAEPGSHSEVIETHLAHLLSAEKQPEKLLEQLEQNVAPAAIWRVICKTPFHALQNQFVEQIEDELQLIDIAISSSPINTRKKAAERITEPALIEQLLKLTRQNDKAIHRIMRDKSSLIREQQKQQQTLQLHAQTVLEQITHLSTGEWYPLYPAKHDALLQDWSTIHSSTTAVYQSRFDEASHACIQRIQAVLDKEAANEKEQQRILQVREAAAVLIDQMQQCIRDLQSAGQSSDSFAMFAQQADQFKTQWALLANDTSSAQQKAFDRLQNQLATVYSHSISIEDKLNSASEFLASYEKTAFKHKPLQEKLKKANAIIKKIAWPENADKPQPIQQLDALLQQLNEEKQQQAEKTRALKDKLQVQLEQLESNIESGSIKAADKASRKASELLTLLNNPVNRSVNGSTNDALDQQYKGLVLRLDEIKDWQGFAVTPKKEQLCLDMEALAEQAALPHPEKAKQIKALQQQWKMLDATDPFHSQAIWKRFKTASDKAYEPCEVFFAQQNEARRYNLQQKELIFSEVATYLQQINWETCDWRSVEQIIQTARQEWRRFTPVDRTPGQALQIKFNELLLEAETHFQAIKESSMAVKQKLILEAESLTTADDASAAAEQAKNLQKAWKECGPTFHSQERKLWKAFRVHCDTIFQRLQDETPSREALQSARQQLKQIIEELSAFEETPLNTQKKINHINETRQLIENYKESLPPHDIEKFNKAARYIEQQASDLTRFVDNAEIQKLFEHAQLCDQFEEMILQNNFTASPEELFKNWQLNSTNDFHEKITKRRNQIESIASSGEVDLEPLLASADKELREICIRLEIALSLPSPERDQALRMEYQMQRLQKALEQQQKSVNLTDIKTLEFECLSVPFRLTNKTLNKRFNQLIDSVFN